MRLRNICFPQTNANHHGMPREAGGHSSISHSEAKQWVWKGMPFYRRASRWQQCVTTYPISFPGAVLCCIKQFCTCIKERGRLSFLSRNLYPCLSKYRLASYPNHSDASPFSGAEYKWSYCKGNLECGLFVCIDHVWAGYDDPLSCGSYFSLCPS